jgi:hypothetical protein
MSEKIKRRRRNAALFFIMLKIKSFKDCLILSNARKNDKVARLSGEVARFSLEVAKLRS